MSEQRRLVEHAVHVCWCIHGCTVSVWHVFLTQYRCVDGRPTWLSLCHLCDGTHTQWNRRGDDDYGSSGQFSLNEREMQSRIDEIVASMSAKADGPLRWTLLTYNDNTYEAREMESSRESLPIDYGIFFDHFTFSGRLQARDEFVCFLTENTGRGTIVRCDRLG